MGSIQIVDTLGPKVYGQRQGYVVCGFVLHSAERVLPGPPKNQQLMVITQRAQHPLMQEYALNQTTDPYIL